jgi:hypothetical protein
MASQVLLKLILTWLFDVLQKSQPQGHELRHWMHF